MAGFVFKRSWWPIYRWSFVGKLDYKSPIKPYVREMKTFFMNSKHAIALSQCIYCLWVCLNRGVRVYMRTHAYLRVCVLERVYRYLYVWVRTCVYTYVYLCACMCLLNCLCMCACECVGKGTRQHVSLRACVRILLHNIYVHVYVLLDYIIMRSGNTNLVQ